MIAEILCGLVVVGIAAGLLSDDPTPDIYSEPFDGDETPTEGN